MLSGVTNHIRHAGSAVCETAKKTSRVVAHGAGSSITLLFKAFISPFVACYKLLKGGDIPSISENQSIIGKTIALEEANKAFKAANASLKREIGSLQRKIVELNKRILELENPIRGTEDEVEPQIPQNFESATVRARSAPAGGGTVIINSGFDDLISSRCSFSASQL